MLFVVDGSFAAKRTSLMLTAPNIDLLDSEAQYINKVLAHGRWNRELTDTRTMELFGQVEKNVTSAPYGSTDVGGTGPASWPIRFRILSSGLGTSLYVGA